jgi:uncharacterized membrane protein
MTDENIKPKKSWMKYLLIVSLGLNLAIAGLVIGAKMGGHGGPRGGHAKYAGGTGMHVLMRSLPDSKRGEVRKYFHEKRDKIRANGDAMRNSLISISTAISARPFDENALTTAFAEQRTHITAVTQDAQKSFVAIIAGMSDDERAEYVENMKEHRHKWEKHRKRNKHKKKKHE